MDPLPCALIAVGVIGLAALVIDIFWIVVIEKEAYMDEQPVVPDAETPHKHEHRVFLKNIFPDGAELWYCPACRCAVIVRWSPDGKIEETHQVNEGNDRPHHGISYRKTSPPEPEPLNFGEPFVPVKADDPRLAPFAAFAEWVEGLDWETEDRKDREE
jgi:hypothetical protein